MYLRKHLLKSKLWKYGTFISINYNIICKVFGVYSMKVINASVFLAFGAFSSITG